MSIIPHGSAHCRAEAIICNVCHRLTHYAFVRTAPIIVNVPADAGVKKADIYFLADNTGSMGGYIATVSAGASTTPQLAARRYRLRRRRRQLSGLSTRPRWTTAAVWPNCSSARPPTRWRSRRLPGDHQPGRAERHGCLHRYGRRLARGQHQRRADQRQEGSGSAPHYRVGHGVRHTRSRPDQMKTAACRRRFQIRNSGIGGAERDRTVDLLNAIQALSQLSYGPTMPGTAGRHGQNFR